MEKSMLKSVIKNFIPGNIVTLNYRTNVATPSGDYNVIAVKKGRGKGGSFIAELKDSNENVILLSTKDSDKVLNVIVGGEMFGYASDSEAPQVYEKNSSRAIELKTIFNTMLKTSYEYPKVINVVSSVPELNGTHTVITARKMRGRAGQTILITKDGVELWSYRHSGVIDSVEIVEWTMNDVEIFEVKESSIIKMLAYDFLMENLEITFKSGVVYRFCGVPKELFSEIKLAGSVGKYFHTNIKPKYDFRIIKTLKDLEKESSKK